MPAFPEVVLQPDEPVLPVCPVRACAVRDDLADVVRHRVVVKTLAGVGAPHSILKWV